MTKKYEAGQGYRDGWNDRHEGEANRCPINGCATSDDLYWNEYRIGYSEACKQVLEDARKTIGEMKQFLAEDVDFT